LKAPYPALPGTQLLCERGVTPPFPEYPSGHSVQSGAAFQVLSDRFGESHAFVDRTHDERGFTPRSFGTFLETAEEAAISRLYGGFHFRAAIANGVTQGRCIGDAVAETFVIGTPQTVTMTKTVKIKVAGKVYTRRVKFQVETVQRLMTCGGGTACDTAVQQVTINPGGHTGWHNHPGPTLVAIAQGEGTLYHGGGTDCMGHKFAGSAGFFQPSAEVHNLRNEGSSPLVLYAFYVLPSGTPNTAIRTDQPQPANCPSIP